MTANTPRKAGRVHLWMWVMLALAAPIAMTVYAILLYLTRPSAENSAYAIGFAVISLVNLDVFYNAGKRRIPYVIRPLHAVESTYRRTKYNPELDKSPRQESEH